jgi:hypothetical protein
MLPSTLEYLHHILDETEYLMGRAKGLTKDEFRLKDALKLRHPQKFNAEQIGQIIRNRDNTW